jgi:thiol-disulfide isomerase/thioredoxin
MKAILLLIFTCLCVYPAQSQMSGRPSGGDYYNNFQTYINDKPDVDSAFYYAKKLSAAPKYNLLFADLIHNSFAQDFINYEDNDPNRRAQRVKRKLLATQILDKMISDSSEVLRKSARPIWIFTKIQDAGNDSASLRKLTNEFLKSEIDGQDIYKHRAGRYGLMIANVLDNYPDFHSLSQQVRNEISAKLVTGQVAVTDSSTRVDLTKRAWYRFLTAYTHFKKSEQSTDRAEKENLLKMAYENSPDLVDKNNSSGYFYDMFMLMGREIDGFGDHYLEIITANGDRHQVLSTLLKMALIQPAYKKKLREVHQEVMPGTDFNQYWAKAVDAQAEKAPFISIPVLGSTSFSSDAHPGKWILVDFWGTWCGPCRQEHPDLQKFHERIVADKSNKIVLLTVACRDTEAKVLDYMQTRKFNFPVAMADGQIEKLYKVQGYPTKILILLTGNYIRIPFGIDWVNFVEQYSQVD